jgi:hypothetical protein
MRDSKQQENRERSKSSTDPTDTEQDQKILEELTEGDGERAAERDREGKREGEDAERHRK